MNDHAHTPETEKSGTQDQLEIYAVADGEIVTIDGVPDDLFSKRMIGDGFAIVPDKGEVCAPVSGRLIEVADTKHAYYIETDRGLKVLIHIGLDTLLLNGNGFVSYAGKHEDVKKGQKLASFDLGLLDKEGFSPVIPVVVLDHPDVERTEVHVQKEAQAGESAAVTVYFK
ncbi:PTS system, glucose-specific IIC component [Alkalibacterium sp. AK22]|uniref:PTS sugar transporter subunit IIA n=1 Tax=Alkalibacterium sp. AK22 TaxID=1229520 RepID=UPI00044A11F0|nr:glucose PTS transporter subunit IIA [Alkalibacterium sp. AK22]EXJ23259.1 PTS system, glucose-specific IIC component [Alkalibacterium sp. AK22]